MTLVGLISGNEHGEMSEKIIFNPLYIFGLSLFEYLMMAYKHIHTRAHTSAHIHSISVQALLIFINPMAIKQGSALYHIIVSPSISIIFVYIIYP